MATLTGVTWYIIVIICISLMASDSWASFHMSLGPLYVFLGEVSVQVLCPFFNWVVCFPGVESCEFFIYFGDQTLVRGSIVKYIFPYGWISFHFADVFFNHAEAFYFDEIPFDYLFLYVLCCRGHIGKNIAVWNICDFPAYVLLYTIGLYGVVTYI